MKDNFKMKLKNSCLICNGKNIIKDLEKNNYSVFLCKNCGLFFVYPQPSDLELKKIYSLKRGYSHSRKTLTKNHSRDEKAVYFKENNKKIILDVGCGCGDFLYSLKNLGVKGIGIEISEDLAKEGIKNNLKILVGNIEKIKFKKNTFDGINLGDILEHVKDPNDLLKKCNLLLRDEGKIIISTPNTNCFFSKTTYFIYKKFGLMWPHPTPPYHLFEFSDNNIVQLLEKNKFKVEKIDYKSIPFPYSIYKTGYFDELRKNSKSTNKKDILRSFFSNKFGNNFRLILVIFLYGVIKILSFGKRKNSMTIFATKGKM